METDAASFTKFVQNELANQRAMEAEAALKGRDFPPPATVGSALDSLDQMPDDVLAEVAGHENIREYLAALLTLARTLHGADALLDSLPGAR